MALGDGYLGDRDALDYWRINGDPVAEDPIEETRSFKQLDLVVQVSHEILTQVLRPLQPDAGSFAVLDRSDGGFVAVDTADGENTHTVEPPANRQPARRQLEWLVADYDEEMQDQSGEKFEVELELVPTESKRQYAGHEDETAGDNDWLLEFEAGVIATEAVSSEIVETSTDGIETIILDLLLEGAQVRKIEESARKLAAVQITDQFDGHARAEDNSPRAVNTMYLEPSAGGSDTITAGHYVVNSWETTWNTQDVYEVEIELISTEAPAPFDPEDFDPNGFVTTFSH